LLALLAGDVSGLPEVHASTAGLKALTTGFTADGIEECRKLCGGNGYLMASGLPDLYCAYVPACTYEGDNYILFLQVCSPSRSFFMSFSDEIRAVLFRA
jgi:acyl-CoA oxidase